MKTRAYSEKNVRRQKQMRMLQRFLILVLAVFLIFRFVIGVSFVNGDSMKNTLQNGQLVVYARILKQVQRGSVVSLGIADGSFYVKRVIAVEGDVVDIRAGAVYVKGEKEQGDYFIGETKPEEGQISYPYPGQPGDVFVLGDNREVSIDSRFYGPFNRSKVIGVLLFVE